MVLPAAEETVDFRRRPELPGVEIRTVEGSSRLWRCFSVGVEFLAPRTWAGDVSYRRRRQELNPGSVFCAYAGEVFSTPEVRSPGGGSAITVEPESLREYLSEYGLAPDRVELRRVTKMSATLSARIHHVFDTMGPEAGALEVQSSLVQFLESMVEELVERSPVKASPARADVMAAERVRECLHFDPVGQTDLCALARQTGLSRFQVLRAFKRTFGLPPHAYQLRVRIGRAQKALRTGRRPAQVALDLGFVDQSHFSRHFKRLVGVTPAQYAAVGLPPRVRRLAEPLAQLATIPIVGG